VLIEGKNVTRNGGPTHGLRATRLLSGDTIICDGDWYERYTPERYRHRLETAGHEPPPPPPVPIHQPAADTEGQP
jgi:hypothetical protein